MAPTTNVAVRDPSKPDHVECADTVDDDATVSVPTSIIDEDDDAVVVVLVDDTISSPISEFVWDHTSNDR